MEHKFAQPPSHSGYVRGCRCECESEGEFCCCVHERRRYNKLAMRKRRAKDKAAK